MKLLTGIFVLLISAAYAYPVWQRNLIEVAPMLFGD